MTSSSKDPARAFVLANSRAGKLARGGPFMDLLTSRRSRMEVRLTASFGELEDGARDAVAAGADVILAGGDGSYGPAITALRRAAVRAGRPLPRLALLPAGTACTVARNWGYAGGGLLAFRTTDAERHAEAVIESVLRGTARTQRRAALSIQVDQVDAMHGDGEHAPRVAFIVGAGLVSRFFELYEGEGATGYRGALGLTTRIAMSGALGTNLARDVLAPVACNIAVDGVMSPIAHASLFLASAVPDLGLGLRAAHRAGTDDERFHAVASPLAPRALLRALPRVLRGRSIGGGLDALVASAHVNFPDGDGALVIDGDLVRARGVRIDQGPVLEILTP